MAESHPTAPPGTRPGSVRKVSSAASWPPAAPSSGFPATSTAPERKRRTRRANRRSTTRPSKSPPAAHLRGRRSPSCLHLEDGEERAQRKRGDDGGDDDRDDSDRGCLPDAEALEGDEIKQERKVGRVFTRTAVGQHENRVERLH